MTVPYPDSYPLTSISAEVYENQPDHASVHNEERRAIQKLNDYVAGMGAAPLDLFAIGGTDSDKLDAAIAYCRNVPGGRQPRIALGNRQYVFTRSIGQPPDGFHLEGVGRGQQGSISNVSKRQHTELKLEIPRSATGKPGYWVNVTSGVARDLYFGGWTAFSDNGFTQAYRAPYVANVSTGFGECTFENQTFQNLWSVFGNESEGVAMTICDIKGGWLIFECRSTGVNLQGSDNRGIFADGVDWYQSSAVSGVGANRFMGIFNALGKSRVGPLYMTAFGGWRALKIAGAPTTGLLSMDHAVIEGNNENEPCPGALIRIEGAASVSITQTTVDDGMTAPSAVLNSNGLADRGLIDIASTTAQVSLQDISFAHATGVPLTTPCVYSDSPKTYVSRFHTMTRGPAWNGALPVVKAPAAALRDSTVDFTAI